MKSSLSFWNMVYFSLFLSNTHEEIVSVRAFRHKQLALLICCPGHSWNAVINTASCRLPACHVFKGLPAALVTARVIGRAGAAFVRPASCERPSWGQRGSLEMEMCKNNKESWWFSLLLSIPPTSSESVISESHVWGKNAAETKGSPQIWKQPWAMNKRAVICIFSPVWKSRPSIMDSSQSRLASGAPSLLSVQFKCKFSWKWCKVWALNRPLGTFFRISPAQFPTFCIFCSKLT